MTNVSYVKNISANFDGNLYLPILHHPRVELHCKLQEKLHHVTGPLIITSSVDIMGKWIIDKVYSYNILCWLSLLDRFFCSGGLICKSRKILLY